MEAPAVRFAEVARRLGQVARAHGWATPVFRSPPRVAGVDRTVRRRPDGTVVVAVKLAGRPFAAVQADLIEGVVVANRLDVVAADRFRRDAWAAVDEGAEVAVVAPLRPSAVA